MIPQTEQHLERRISQGEGETLDFKFQITSSRKIAISLVAFANTIGGSLLIGVKDNGKIAGVVTDEEWHMVEAAAHMYTKPKIELSRKVWQINHKRVLEVIVTPSEEIYKAEVDPDKWRTFIRIADENIAINRIIAQTIKKEVEPKAVGALNENELNLIRLFKDAASFSLNQWVKKSDLSKKRAEQILTNFILWGLIDWHIQSDGSIRYSIAAD